MSIKNMEDFMKSRKLKFVVLLLTVGMLALGILMTNHQAVDPQAEQFEMLVENAYPPLPQLPTFDPPIPNPKMDLIKNPLANLSAEREVRLRRNSFPLHYHSWLGIHTQHLQAMIKLPDANGKQYYMGTYSQNHSDSEGGMVFVAEVSSGNTGDVIWIDELTAEHLSGGYNHPGDLHKIGNYVIVAGQNWSECIQDSFFGCLLHTQSFILTKRSDLQNVLFYDVVNPAKPKYIGQLNRCLEGNDYRQFGSDSQEIDTISVAHSNGYYYLSFGRGEDGLKCRSTTFDPNAQWEVIDKTGDSGDSPAYFYYGGKSYVGKASFDGTNVVFKKFRFRQEDTNRLTENTNAADMEEVVTEKTSPMGYWANHYSVSSLPDGSYCVLSTKVVSKGDLFFKEKCQ
ncbi:MAG: hypothetical protein F6K58_18145 [Symploca sp. SIO2E9]|nr:hypothetical protein [Symploca sp. SIO2E9]